MTTILRNHAVSIRDTFRLDVPAEVQTSAFPKDWHPSVPETMGTYEFRRETLRDFLAFLDNPNGDGFYLYGHFGSGKTTLPYQVSARLNWPIVAYTAHSRTEFEDLVGGWKLVAGTMTWMDGPLTIAMREGRILVLNEVDRCDPGQWAGLYDVLEGHPLTIAANGGEVVKPSPYFRIVATGNGQAGNGDSTGLYHGVNPLDAAFLDRFRMVEVEYPSEDVELNILAKRYPELPEEIRQKMVRVANMIRRLFVGGEESATPLTITLSTRSLDRWALLTLTFRNAPNALSYALNQALLNRAEPEQRIAIERIAKDVFGSSWSQEDAA